MKILIVDDSSLMRERIAAMVGENSKVHIVGEAASGECALQMYRKHRPDFTILDLRMPGMSGIEVLKELQHEDHQGSICVLTNYDQPQYRRHCLKLGARYFLNKNRDFSRLKPIIDSAVSA